MDLREFSELVELRYKREDLIKVGDLLTESEEYRYRVLDAKASAIGEKCLNELYQKFKNKGAKKSYFLDHSIKSINNTHSEGWRKTDLAIKYPKHYNSILNLFRTYESNPTFEKKYDTTLRSTY